MAYSACTHLSYKLLLCTTILFIEPVKGRNKHGASAVTPVSAMAKKSMLNCVFGL